MTFITAQQAKQQAIKNGHTVAEQQYERSLAAIKQEIIQAVAKGQLKIEYFWYGCVANVVDEIKYYLEKKGYKVRFSGMFNSKLIISWD